jgi:hypothetical protein
LHIGVQSPPAQTCVATFVEEHARPQAPQLSTSVAGCVSHPSEKLPLQSA